MAPYVFWFVLALALVGLEMATGTFYMLVFAMAMSVAGLAALVGLGMPLQVSLAGIFSVVGTVILRRMKTTHPSDAASQNLEIGQQVQVVTWHENGTARVHYRGAEWDAELESSDIPHSSTLYIKAMRGSTLILTQHKP